MRGVARSRGKQRAGRLGGGRGVVGPDRRAPLAGEHRVERGPQTIQRVAGEPTGLGWPAFSRHCLGADDVGDRFGAAGVDVGRCGFARAGQVAGPPAGLGEIGDAREVERVATGECFEVDARRQDVAAAQEDAGDATIGVEP